MPLLETARMVTLTGAGGSGKTRLALEVAAHASPRFSRVAWVDLAPLNDANLLAEQVGAALNARERAESPLTMLTGAIGVEHVLIVLDNCEHLVDACASLVDAMLRACPRLTVLATSREALGVPGETAWLVPPLATAEATQLFVERAQAAFPGFQLTDANTPSVHEICHRLDGIPLAIELAAARVRVLSPEQIVARLDDAFRLLSSGSRTALPRHRTLRATMEWSVALLGPREQTLMSRLAVFSGSFTLEAAEAVCSGDDLDVDDILDGVGALVDKSLIVMDAGDGVARYRLLETVRQYGRERLETAGDRGAMQLRHAQFFLGLLEDAAPYLPGGANQPGLVPRLAAEYANIRAAAVWAVSPTGDADMGLRFAGGLFWFGYAMGQFRELRQLIDYALARCSTCHPVARGRALLSSGLTALAQGDFPLALAHLSESTALLRQENDESQIGTVLAKLGAAHLMSGDVERAIPLLDEAVAYGKTRDRRDMGAVFARYWRGWAAFATADYDLAFSLFEQNVIIGRALQLLTTEAHATIALARVEVARGNLDAACAFVMDGLEQEARLGDAWGLSSGLDVVVITAARRGRDEDAVRLAAGTEAHRQRMAMALPGHDASEFAHLLGDLKTRLGSRFDALYADGYALSTADVVRLALAEAARHTTEYRAAVTAELPAPVVTQPRLRVAALGPLEVFVNNTLIAPTAWGSARPRELLVYLLLHPEGRTKEQVGLAFWPEASAAQLRNNFHVTLHRLRRALGGAEWISLVGDRYRVDPALIESFDVPAFTQAVAHARRAMSAQDAGATPLLEAAAALYRGRLLEAEPAGDWHQAHRDHFDRLYIDTLMALGERQFADERVGDAEETYRRVLERDPLREDAALALMRCHSATGDRGEALRVYRRLAERLQEELGAAPGQRIVQLAERLRRTLVRA